MNKPIIAALAAMAVLTSTAGVAYAQYTGGGSVGSASPEQLQECQQLGIPTENCNDVTILAKKRLTAAQENPATGSGTPMLSTSSGQLIVFIAVLGAIFGGVAAAFFFRGRGAKPVKT
ncbi:MAG: hypothetical protein M3286_07055 [Thermoproteota archaeon]|jgi:hypothetical protein|nr:hypothetical protein [Thermoproteota archaeon]